MSRSRRRTPIIAITGAESEKRDKQLAHRRERRVVKHALHTDPHVDLLPHRLDVSNPWMMDKDGKQYLEKPSKKDMRK